VIDIDESGFEASTFRPDGWSNKGQKIHGERSGQTRPRTSLIALKGERSYLPRFYLLELPTPTGLITGWNITYSRYSILNLF